MTHRKVDGTRIKWSLFFSFCVFALLILLLFWTTIGLFSSNFYFWVMRSRMDNAVYEIMLLDGRPDFKERAEMLALDEQAGLLVYYVEDNEASLVTSARYDADGITQAIDGDWVRTLYARAVAAGGKARLRLHLNEETGELKEETQMLTSSSSRLLTVMVSERPGGSQMMVVLDSSISVPASLGNTVRELMFGFSLLVFGIAAAISFIFAKHISYPIERLTARVKQLPQGEFRMDHPKKSYLEIEELGDALEHAAEEISRVDRLQKELIANISHDLRTPLTMIAGYAEVMRDIEGENTPENIQVIIDETERLSSLVNDLLEISKIQGGGTTVQIAAVPISDVVEQTVDRYRHLKESAGFTFSFEGCTPSVVWADQKRILQVICNLLNNAINYSDDDRRIEVCCRRVDGRVRVEIRDHGQGIPKDELEGIWQRYYKAKQNHRRAAIGSGLGLSIVREILEQHDARYGVTSTVGVGSLFWFELPLVAAQAPESLPPARKDKA